MVKVHIFYRIFAASNQQLFMYKIRVILDSKEDVIRTICVNNSIHLEVLHFTIAKSFGFNGQQMASFYRTDAEWNQGEEIPLFDMGDEDVEQSMKNYYLQDTLPKTNEKLIYVYDFLNLWTFYVEVIDINSDVIDAPNILLSVGEIPADAPEKEFKAAPIENDIFGEEEDSFDDYDEFDYNAY